jgi:L-rhamnose-H+ transport protein
MNVIVFGVILHAVGAMFAANCYAPQKYVKRWSWETFWVVQAAWCWLLWPIVGAVYTIPDLGQVLSESWASSYGPRMFYCFLMGAAFGIGGTAFNLSIKYIGFSLTYAIAIGLSGVLGMFVTPLVKGTLGEKLQKPGAGWLVAGVVVGTLGIALCGLAGRFKERDLQEKESGPGEFSLAKGLLLSLLAGVLSAVYGIGLYDVAGPIVEIADKHGAGQWKTNIASLFVNPGAFVTALVYCLYLARKNRSLSELVKLRPGPERGSLLANYLLAILTGALWYGQFFISGPGRVRLGVAYEFSSWAMLMIMIVLFSTILALIFREWKGCRPRTLVAITAALLVLVTAVLMLTYGNYLGDKTKSASAGEDVPVAKAAFQHEKVRPL